jgi:hypothetical protein
MAADAGAGLFVAVRRLDPLDAQGSDCLVQGGILLKEAKEAMVWTRNKVGNTRLTATLSG